MDVHFNPRVYITILVFCSLFEDLASGDDTLFITGILGCSNKHCNTSGHLSITAISNHKTIVIIRQPLMNDDNGVEISLKPGQTHRHFIPILYQMHGLKVENKGILIKSDHQIRVEVYGMKLIRGKASFVLPVNDLGLVYQVHSLNKKEHSTLAIISSEDDTLVHIMYHKINANIIKDAVYDGSGYRINLDKYQTIQIPDIDDTVSVTSNKPVAILQKTDHHTRQLYDKKSKIDFFNPTIAQNLHSGTESTSTESFSESIRIKHDSGVIYDEDRPTGVQSSFLLKQLSNKYMRGTKDMDKMKSGNNYITHGSAAGDRLPVMTSDREKKLKHSPGYKYEANRQEKLPSTHKRTRRETSEITESATLVLNTQTNIVTISSAPSDLEHDNSTSNYGIVTSGDVAHTSENVSDAMTGLETTLKLINDATEGIYFNESTVYYRDMNTTMALNDVPVKVDNIGVANQTTREPVYTTVEPPFNLFKDKPLIVILPISIILLIPLLFLVYTMCKSFCACCGGKKKRVAPDRPVTSKPKPKQFKMRPMNVTFDATKEARQG